MQLSMFPAFASLLALTSAASLRTSAVTVVCTDFDPITVTQTQTITVTAPCEVLPPLKTQIITTSAQAIPTISIISKENSVNAIVTIINGATTTIYSTKTDAPKSTPTPPATQSSTVSIPIAAPTRAAVIHKVIVGIDGTLAYGANQITAAIGDIIRFDFNSTNHTVTQSDFLTPCSPKAGGFNTGFNQFNPSNKTGVVFKDFKVEVSTPLWFYCAQTAKVSHCHKGMVLGVNPNGKFPAFLSMATATTSPPSAVTASATGTGGMPFGTGKNGALLTEAGKPFGTGVSSSIIPLYTAGRPSASSTGSVISIAKPTVTASWEHAGHRRGATPWFA